MKRTAVVILTWNNRGYLESFLPSLVGSIEGLDAEVVIADNASSDGSLEYVRAEFPQLKTIALKENTGFTGGYNAAIKALLKEGASAPEYVVLINSDIETAPGWLEPLVAYMDHDPLCGACGPKLHALDCVEGKYVRTDRFEYAGAAGGYIDRFGFPYCRGRVLKRTEEDYGQYDRKTDVAWVSGACLMTRTALWQKLGGLDDRFFAHMEEIDYCWRLWLAGYRVSVIPESTVWHLGGGSLPQNSPRKLMLNYRNGLMLLDNNLPLTVGSRRAKLKIAVRKALDWAAAAAYLLMLKPEYAGAVSDAHRQFRKLRLSGKRDGRRCIHPAGTGKICIIPAAFLKGEGVFEYLRKYEDSH